MMQTSFVSYLLTTIIVNLLKSSSENIRIVHSFSSTSSFAKRISKTTAITIKTRTIITSNSNYKNNNRQRQQQQDPFDLPNRSCSSSSGSGFKTILFANQNDNQEGGGAKENYFATATTTSIGTSTTTTTSSSTKNELPTFRDEVQRDADGALLNVGWSLPTSDNNENGELTSNDPFVMAINESIQKEMGVPLDELLNPAKVVNLERDLYLYRTQLAKLTGGQTTTTTTTENSSPFLITSECDGGGGGVEADKLRQMIQKKETDLLIERRSVFRGWLKNVFLGQAILSFGLSYIMATNPKMLFGQNDWYYMYNMDLSISVLGYWWWWLFVVPSLRSRRPKGFEKKALDIAFIATPLVSILAPIGTKDTGIIWGANCAVVLASYLFAYVTPEQEDDDNNNNDDDSKKPEWLKFIYKSLDFGSGRERGARQ